MNPRRRNFLKLRATQAKEAKKNTAVPEVVAEEMVAPVAEEPKVKSTKTERKRTWEV